MGLGVPWPGGAFFRLETQKFGFPIPKLVEICIFPAAPGPSLPKIACVYLSPQLGSIITKSLFYHLEWIFCIQMYDQLWLIFSVLSIFDIGHPLRTPLLGVPIQFFSKIHIFPYKNQLQVIFWRLFML